MRIRLPKDQSRELILNESLHIMVKNGWSGLSFQAIAKRCRMSPSNIVYHFQNRESLLHGLLLLISENNWRIVQSGIRPEFDAYRRLRTHFEMNHQWAQTFPEQAQVILQIYTEAVHSSEFAKVFEIMIQRAEGRLMEYLLAGKREGLFHYKTSNSNVARTLQNLLMGICIYATSGRMTPIAANPRWDEILKPIVGFQRP